MEYALGIDVGGMSVKCGIVDQNGKVIDTLIIEVNSELEGHDALNLICNKLIPFLNKSEVKIKGIGIGIPGLVNIKKGMIVTCPNLPKWNDLSIKSIMEEKLHIPVKISNDANVAALGEATFGSSKQYSTSIMLTLGTGVGSGVIINHQLYEGNNGQGGELGHSLLVLDGLPCGCGRRGCLEQYASASGLMRQIKEKMILNKDSIMWKLVDGDINKVNGKVAFDAEQMGDQAGKEVVDQYVKYLSEGILNFCDIFRPEIIILSGGVAKQGKNLTTRIEKYLQKFHYGFVNAAPVKVETASIGYQSGIIGAACLFLGD